MKEFNSIKIVPKFEIETDDELALVYTPGVGAVSNLIKDNSDASFIYTNRANSVGVFAFDYKEATKRAIFLKSTLSIDAYPFEIENPNDIDFILDNLEPNFCAFDVSLLNLKNKKFKLEVPVLVESVQNLSNFFNAFAKTIFLENFSKLDGTTAEKAIELRDLAQGVIESALSKDEIEKPVAILTDGSAVLGLGNIKAYGALPVMEGKSYLFQMLGGVSAIPICIKTQETFEIIRLAKLLKNSFSGINLEDICAPKCFEIEEKLIEMLDIPVFHDDQHGTAIVVLAGILNSICLAKKDLKDLKIIFSGAGAAAQAVARLLLQAGAKNIILTNRKGAVYKGNPENDDYLEKIAQITNPKMQKGTLKDVIKGADVFIGLSCANLLDEKAVKSMAKNPIIFALANPIPEIMPDVAKNAGAFIVATGRSDFENQINNSLVFPSFFRGLLDNKIKKVTTEMKINAALALASCVKQNDLSVENILPHALSSNVFVAIKKSFLC